ncbi:unnamed protein product [Trifolium pratense]|uniref:Uncharacterized protein n=1 Tax=Trifolium pratense TaxID=57577 RepID=A0ACB0J4X2_TRIPR|nr:unnamed protein product [Trifolium pratense]
MAVAVVGEAFLSAFIEVVLDRLTSPQVVNLIRGKKFDVNLVQGLKNTLYVVEAVLNDAEQKARNSSETPLLTNGLMTSKMLSMLLMTFWIISLLKLLLLGTKRRNYSGAGGSGNSGAGVGGSAALTPNQWSDLSGFNSPQLFIDVVVAPRESGDGRHSSEQFICFVSFFFNLFKL